MNSINEDWQRICRESGIDPNSESMKNAESWYIRGVLSALDKIKTLSEAGHVAMDLVALEHYEAMAVEVNEYVAGQLAANSARFN